MSQHGFLDFLGQHFLQSVRANGSRCDAIDPDIFGAQIEGDIANEVIGCGLR